MTKKKPAKGKGDLVKHIDALAALVEKRKKRLTNKETIRMLLGIAKHYHGKGKVNPRIREAIRRLHSIENHVDPIRFPPPPTKPKPHIPKKPPKRGFGLFRRRKA